VLTTGSDNSNVITSCRQHISHTTLHNISPEFFIGNTPDPYSLSEPKSHIRFVLKISRNYETIQQVQSLSPATEVVSTCKSIIRHTPFLWPNGVLGTGVCFFWLHLLD